MLLMTVVEFIAIATRPVMIIKKKTKMLSIFVTILVLIVDTYHKYIQIEQYYSMVLCAIGMGFSYLFFHITAGHPLSQHEINNNNNNNIRLKTDCIGF